MEPAKDESWCLDLSYIKPHWPYIVSAPNHDMYGAKDLLAANRSDAERVDPHPLMQGIYDHRYSHTFCRDDERNTVIPAYMGLITQIDDQVGRVVQYLEDSGQADETMIVLTSDHGDYLGDHWLGEKELFHDCSARVPLIIVDPSKQPDAARGEVNTDLTEAIDLVPTFVDFFDGKVADHILEGQSLLPALRGEDGPVRPFVVSEYDSSARPNLRHLSPNAKSCGLTMIFDGRWKFIWVEGHRPILYDLQDDPKELTDLGASSDHAKIIALMKDHMFSWSRRMHTRVAISDDRINDVMCRADAVDGVYLGFWEEEDLDVWKRAQAD